MSSRNIEFGRKEVWGNMMVDSKVADTHTLVRLATATTTDRAVNVMTGANCCSGVLLPGQTLTNKLPPTGVFVRLLLPNASYR